MTQEAADIGAIAKKAASPKSNTAMKRRSADESAAGGGQEAGSPRKSTSPPSCEELAKPKVDENTAPPLLVKPGKKRRLGMRMVPARGQVDKPKHRWQPMNGTSICMPTEFKPYPNQNQMIIHTLRAMASNGRDGRGQNAIIESPTGSGKTMGLLMPSCSWLSEFKEKREEVERKCPIHGYPGTADQSFKTAKDESRSEKTDESDGDESKCTCGGRQRIQIYYSTRTHKQIAQVVQEYRRLAFAEQGVLKHTVLGSRENYCINPDVRNGPGSIDTKCKELCASKGGCGFKNELSRYERRPDLLRDVIRRNAATGSEVFDMEDLRDVMADVRCCPYFASSQLAKDADVIFCPFPYLLYPRIRKASPVNLSGAIVILDEAHNVEEVCRDAASVQFDALEVEYALYDVKQKRELLGNKFMWGSRNAEASSTDGDEKRLDDEKEVSGIADDVAHQLENIEKCVMGVSQLIKAFHETTATKPKKKLMEKTFDDEQLLERLEGKKLLLDIGFEESLEKTLDWLTHPDGSFDTVKNHIGKEVRPSPITLCCVEKYLLFLKFFRPVENRPYYRCHVKVEEQADHNIPGSVRHRVRAEYDSGGATYRDSELEKTLDSKSDTTVSLWCMSPSVAFREAFEKSRTVILASGTLSPVDSLKTELGLSFPIVYQGAQVIPKEQMFVRAVSHGPRGMELRNVYANQKSATYMSELVDAIAGICRAVKGGVLCFLPSYGMLYNLDLGRLENKLNGAKILLVEPRSTYQLEEVFNRYKQAVELPMKHGPDCHGALLLGVCRGKVSEGIDFTDDFARCVITVGIPYPNVKDPLVIGKKTVLVSTTQLVRLQCWLDFPAYMFQFNDFMRRQDSSVISGDDWAKMGAFRALNQALGRCLRHRDDWGALIMLESRVAEAARHHTDESRLISKWVQEVLKPQSHCDYTGFAGVVTELGQFCAKMQLHKRETASEGGTCGDSKTAGSA